jgi:hypothetical protein
MASFIVSNELFIIFPFIVPKSPTGHIKQKERHEIYVLMSVFTEATPIAFEGTNFYGTYLTPVGMQYAYTHKRKQNALASFFVNGVFL